MILITSEDVYIFNLDTGRISRITDTGNAGRQIWSRKNQIIYWTNNHLFQVNLSDSTKKTIDIPVPSKIGFRPLDISLDEGCILLHTFDLKNPGEDQSLEKFYLSNNEIVKIISSSGFNGANWLNNN